jgi:hypothetical protein
MPPALPATPPQIAEALVRSLGVNLRSVLLHGPRGDAVDPMRPSTWRFLLVVERTSPDIVHSVRQVWRASAPGLPPPRLFTRAGLSGTADAYTVEFVEIRLNHELLYGDDPLEPLEFSEKRFLFELEHELQRLRQRLRQAALELGGRDRPLLAELLRLTPAALALFRGALRFVGETPAPEPADLLLQLSRRAPLHAGGLVVLAARLRERAAANDIPADTLLEQFLMDVESVCVFVHTFQTPRPATEPVAAPDAEPGSPPPEGCPQGGVGPTEERPDPPPADDPPSSPPVPPTPSPPPPSPAPRPPPPPPPAPARHEQQEFLFPC